MTLKGKKKRDYARDWYRDKRQANPDWYAAKLLSLRQNKIQQRLVVLTAYGNKCECCGETRYEFLAIDHINGGGNKHRKEIGGSGTNLVQWLIKNNFPKGFRILCHNCNMSYGHHGYCPHQGD